MSQPDRLSHLIEEFRRLRHNDPRIGERQGCAIAEPVNMLQDLSASADSDQRTSVGCGKNCTTHAGKMFNQ
jgi:hypothetical protein